jgi:hypothetical protein
MLKILNYEPLFLGDAVNFRFSSNFTSLPLEGKVSAKLTNEVIPLKGEMSRGGVKKLSATLTKHLLSHLAVTAPPQGEAFVTPANLLT